MSLKQFKLVTGEEVICEVLEDNDSDIAVRNALVLQLAKNDEGNHFYQFRPFMTYQDDSTKIVLIMMDKIISLAIPPEELIEQYKGAMEQLESINSGEYEELDEEDKFISMMEQMSIDSDNTPIH